MSTTVGLSKINIVTKAEYDANAPYPDNELAMIPIGSTVIDSYSDENGNWYRKYSDGWVEQGGGIAVASFCGQSYACPSRYSTQTFTFLVPFSSTDFDMKFTIKRTDTSTQTCAVSQLLKSVTSSSAEVEFIREQDGGSSHSVGGRWYACGMGV